MPDGTARTDSSNRRVLLARRPRGAPKPGDFAVVDGAVPVAGPGQVLLRNLFLSLDPYMRGLMDEGAPTYAPRFALGEAVGGGTVAEVAASSHEAYRAGDLVAAHGGWQTFALSDGADLRRLPPGMEHPSSALGVLGMTGFTAWHGLTAIGQPRPGETLVVGAAAGAVGAVAGQIGKVMGCRVVGVAGGPEKCRHAVEDLGFDACLDHRAPDLAGRLAAAAPDGVDVYFESVGGAVREAVWPHLNAGARVPVCGLVSGYNGAPEEPAGGVHRLLMSLIVKRVRLEGFMIGDHHGAFDAFRRQMDGWLASGQVRAREEVVDGLENAPAAFAAMLEGRSTGKSIVRIAARSA